MIRGDKPSAYTVTYKDGVKVEGEQRQCVHCQYLWDYVPGSGIRRGWCMKCKGLICARPECIEIQKRKTGNQYDCMPFEEEQKILRDKLDKRLPIPEFNLSNYDITKGGIIIKK